MTERGLYPDIFPATDWYSAMFKDLTMNQRANISVSGGGTVARYYVAANMTRDNGNVKVDKRNNFNSNINLMKYTIRSNVNVNLTKTTELVLRMRAAFDDYSGKRIPYCSSHIMNRMKSMPTLIIFCLVTMGMLIMSILMHRPYEDITNTVRIQC